MEKEPDSVHYAPFQATPRALFLLAAIVAACFLLGRVPQLDPALRIFRMFTGVGWILLACLPFAAVVQLGWSYDLIGDEFVARRFGRERHRIPLRFYERTSFTRLHFRHDTLWLVAGADAPRQAFLEAIVRRARLAGADGARHVVTQLDVERVRIRLAALHLAPRCVTCGAPATATAYLRAQRGFDFFFVSYFQSVELPVPLCDQHRRRLRIARWLGVLASLPFTIVVAGLLYIFIAGAVWSGVFIIAVLIVALVYPRLHRMVVRQRVDWLAVGISASRLSADLTEVTLRVRNPATLAAIVDGVGDTTTATGQHFRMKADVLI